MATLSNGAMLISVPPSGLQPELLERVTPRRGKAAAHGERPRHFAHVDVTPRVQGEPMWRREAAGRAGVGAAPSWVDPSRPGIDADPAVPPVLEGLVARGVGTLVPPQLG